MRARSGGETPEDGTRLWVVVVRVADGKRRRRVDEVLRFAGERLRVGAYEVAATGAGMRRLEERVGECLGEGDLVRIYPVCARCRQGVRMWGEGDLAALPVAWVL